ncbi:gigaxonin-like [Haliotis cracherodii]|uniref:gigaxonin-like n=1 Tax=Haliotis cracherodii TaxID=6455 RepID=UPI0039ED36EA
MAKFVVSNASPLDDVSSTGSSYEDGPVENGGWGGERGSEARLYVLNRGGTGEAHYLLLTPDRSDIHMYRTHIEVWKPLVDIMNFGVVVVDNFLYIVGGFDRSRAQHLNRVLRYDPAEGLWVECAPMLIARAKCGVCAQGGRIYVSGGEKSDSRVTGSCEVYDIETDTWCKAGMLVAARANHVCAVYNNEIYCAGGYHGNKTHDNLWVYEEHTWRELDEHYPHTLPCPLDRFTIATLDNTFYFIGGVTSRADRKCPDKPDYSTQRRIFSFTTNISLSDGSTRNDVISPWEFHLPNMNHARHSHGTATIGRKLYVVGGSCLETGQPINVCEFYNTETGEWEEDFRFRKGDMSNVVCAILEVPRIPVNERKMTSKLKWVLW